MEAICHPQRLPTDTMKSKSLGFVHRGLAISLMAASGLLSAQLGYATPAMMAQGNVSQSNSNLPDVKAMIERANKLRSEGKYRESAAIWLEILTILEKALGPDDPYVATSLQTWRHYFIDKDSTLQPSPLFAVPWLYVKKHSDQIIPLSPAASTAWRIF
jgi:hypothetical protein